MTKNNKKEKKIISVRIIGNQVVSYNSLEEGIIFENDIIKQMKINGIKYYIELDEENKIYLKWNKDKNILDEPTIEEFKKIVGTF